MNLIFVDASTTGCANQYKCQWSIDSLVYEDYTYLCLGVQHDLKIVTVTHPELLAKKDNFAISAVADEDRRF